MIYIIIIAVLVILLIREPVLRRVTEKDMVNISEKLDSILKNEDYKPLLYNTNKEGVKLLLNSINDLIYRKMEEKTLRLENEKRINETLTNMSHDLRTPLTLIQGYVEYIEINNDGNREEKEIIKLMNIKIKEVVNMINSFFSLAKLESGDEKITLSKVNLSKIIRNNLVNNYTVLTKEDFKVETEFEKNDLFIMGNEDSLNRIINNLIINVIKHGSDSKYLKVSLAKREENIILQVIDKGIGIPQENIDSIFKRGYTTKKTGTNGFNGSGLGLRITKILVEAMNGKIEVVSKVYVETIFSIKFPCLNNI